MKSFLGLTKRNLLIFFKDKQSMGFSLLASIIVLILYLLFLKGTFVDAIYSSIDRMEGLKSLIDEGDIKMYANITLLVGVLGSAMITVPYNCLTTVVRDRENKVDYDVLATPIKRWKVIISYFVSAVISSVIMTGIILTAGLLILSLNGNIYMGAADIFAAYMLVALGSISATALFMIVALLFKSSQASGAFFGIISAAAGFVIGAYIPISQFSESVQTVCNLFPGSHATILLRNVLLNGTLNAVNESIGGVDKGIFVETLRDIFSFEARIFGHSLGIGQMIMYVAAGILICVIIQVMLFTKTYKKK